MVGNPGWTLLSESWIFDDSCSEIQDAERIIESIRSLDLENVQEIQIQEDILAAVKSARIRGKQSFMNFPILIQIWITGLNPLISSGNAQHALPDAQKTQNRVGIYLIEKTLEDIEINYKGSCRVVDVRIYGQ